MHWESGSMKSKCRLADAGRFNRQLPEHLRLKLLFCFISVAVLCNCAIAQENTAESWYKKGIELENNGSYVEAIKAYEQSIELNQSYAPAWSAKGALLFGMGKKDDAELAFEKAIDLYNETLEKNPQDTIAWIDRGVAFTYLDRQEESIESRQKALEIFNQTVEKNSSDPQALSDKAFTLAGMGRYSESIEALDRVIELTSNPTPVSYTHLRAHETVLDLVCRLLRAKKKNKQQHSQLFLVDFTTATDGHY